VSREVDPNNPTNTEDFIYLAHRNLLTQDWIDANGGDEGVSEILNGDRKVKKPKGHKAPAAEAEPEEVEEADDGDDDAETETEEGQS